jgi:hypothetical protein
MNYPHLVIARLYEHIEPIDRGNRYDDPLQARLDESRAGRVTGGGSQLNDLGGIDYVELELELANLEEAIGTVSASLEQSGAPKGSELIDGGDHRVLREFGTHECLVIFLDGVTLPDAVYAELDFEAVVEALQAAAGPASYHGFSQGAEETGLYFFGPNADDMFAAVEPALRSLPIGQNARASCATALAARTRAKCGCRGHEVRRARRTLRRRLAMIT